MGKEHAYEVTVRWTGNSGSGTASYRSYNRDHDIVIDGKPTIEASADPAFLGSPERWSPEDLLVASLSQCHMLTYLSECARNGVVVTSYSDTARGVMREAPGNSGQFTEVVLHPVVAVADAAMTDKAAALHREAHEACFVANSVNFPVRHVPSVRVRAADHDSPAAPGY
jgi:organic hydroperoxide reductase OsmC/OhrA